MHFIFSSIRMKMTLALLFVGLFSIVTVGFISRGIMLDHFNDLVVEDAARGFVSEARAYYLEYGSWEQARNTESFFDYARRSRPELFSNGPPRPQGEVRPPAGDGTGNIRNWSMGGEPPPFIVTDDAGQVILPLFGDYVVGDPVSQSLLDRAIPIMDGSTLLGMAVPEQRIRISGIEARYLSVFETSWLISLVLACIVALLLGWFFGKRLTSPIVHLECSMDAISKGELDQELDVKSSDELGRLTEIFNKMSKDLAKSYRDLESSNRLLSQYSNWLVAENKRILKIEDNDVNADDIEWDED